MATSVHVDLIEGNAGKVGVYGWIEKTAIIRVLGLAKTPGQDDLISQALAASEAAGFTYYSAHPSIAGLYLLGERPCKVISDTAVEIVAVYCKRTYYQHDPEYVRVRGRVSLVTEKTNKDATGDDLVTEHKEASDRPFKRQHGTIDKGLPCLTLQFSRRQTENPAAMAVAVIGRRNAAGFQGSVAGTWLVTGVDFGSDDGGDHWDFSVETTQNLGLWKQTIYFIGQDGQIPANWDAGYQEGKTVKLVTVYGSVDYTQLDLPVVIA